MKISVISGLITFAILSLSFALIHVSYMNYGLSAFFVTPAIVGFICGKKSYGKESLKGVAIGAFLFIAMILWFSWEGILCILFASPLMFASMWIGIMVRRLFSGMNKGNNNRIQTTVLPAVVLFVSCYIEHMVIRSEPYQGTVQTSTTISADKNVIFNFLIDMGTLDYSKSWAMHLGLPHPVRCESEGQFIGSKRVCYFDEGSITQKIVQLVSGDYVEMDIVDYDLVGRQWLGFKKASYELQPVEDDKINIVRQTTYHSSLRPRFYWHVFEEWGIEMEHQYVFEILKNNMETTDTSD